MSMLKRFTSIALGSLIVATVCFTPAEAAYKPKITSKMGGQAMKDVQKVVTTLKAMPKSVRWDFLAERLGLLFMPPNGTSGHHNDTGNMLDGSHFIGVDGMEYDARAECNARPKDPDTWVFSYGIVDRVGREVVFSKMSSEVTALVLENAKYHLEKMAEEQPERRDMYLAHLAKLCYLPDGKSPYEKMLTKTGPHKQPIQYYELGGKGCKFVDTEGNEHNFDDITKKYSSLGGARWEILNVCAHHVGRKDILALCPEEVKKLRANYKKKMQELGVGATETKEAEAEEETNEPSVKAEALAKKLGVTYRPKANADRMGGQFKKDLDSVVKYLKSLPKSQRWCYIAERMGLMFMPQDGSLGYGSNSWYKAGAHFIGANGLEYDAQAELDVINNKGTRSEWNKYTGITDRLGRALVFSKFPDEVAELVLQNAKYHLDKLAAEHPEGRDAILARIAQLEYLSDGTSLYVLKTMKGVHGDMFTEFLMDAPWQKYYFTDTDGKERRTVDAYITGQWFILLYCAHHLGADAILALCPEEVKKLRENYKKKMQELGVSVTEPKKDKAEEKTSKPSARAESLSKKLGVAYRPKTNADRMGGQFKKDVQNVLKYLDSIPKPMRWFFFAERMGLFFMPANGEIGHKDNGWPRGGCHYIGVDGLEYDADSEWPTCPDRSEWGAYGWSADRLGREVVFSQLPEEIAEFVLQNAKYQLDKMAEEQPERRDLLLAYLAGLCYMPDGSSAYGAETTLMGPHKQPISHTPLDPHCKFIDTNGVEQDNDAVTQKYAALKDARWPILNVCAHHVGKDAILALCPKEVKKLRANYEKRVNGTSRVEK